MSELQWRKSSFTDNGTCVEVADVGDGSIVVRDDKLGESSPVLTFDRAEMSAFIKAVKAGEFDDLT